jgi:hypothetical protein
MTRNVKITPEIENQIVAARLKGVKEKDIAKTFGLSPWTVNNKLKKLRELEGGTFLDYKERLKKKGIEAVESGLDCPDDPYKRGTLGVSVLKGIGEFSDTTTQLVGVLVQTMPKEYAIEAERLDKGEELPLLEGEVEGEEQLSFNFGNT